MDIFLSTLFFCFIIALFSYYYFATIDCVADEGVGPEDFEDPEDFAEPSKQPLTISKKPILCMSYGTSIACNEIMIKW